MKQLQTINAAIKHCCHNVDIVLWERGDPFPDIGPSVGVDTETELITDCNKAPPMVVYGCYDAANRTCYIVYWKDVVPFVRALNSRNIEQRYFNLGFDEIVIDNEDSEQTLITAIDQGRVRDMQIRIHLHNIATKGWIPHNQHSLEGCTLEYLNWQLDKGDPDNPEESARLTFTRYNKDGSEYKITDAQAVYLAYDCMSTWALGEEVPEVPTEVQHTQGMVVLGRISYNGMKIDPIIFDEIERRLLEKKEDSRKDLLMYGFPDPDKDPPKEARDAKMMFAENLERFINNNGTEFRVPGVIEAAPDTDEEILVPKICKKNTLRKILAYLYNRSDGSRSTDSEYEFEDEAYTISELYNDEKASMRKDVTSLYNAFVEKYETLAFDASKKQHVLAAFVGKVLEYFNESGMDAGKFDTAVAYAGEYMDQHDDWLATEPPIGPRKFFQEHVRKLLEEHTDLKLDTTEKSGDIKLTLKDMWRLEDLDIKDNFLAAFTSHCHFQKYLSTYLNRAHIDSTGRVHSRFTSILKTGRTSSTSPNCQNYPSRDKAWPLKNIYCADDGMVLCATDFSFIELCGFAQACYTRFGYSVMRDVINAGLDPHRWFSGVMFKHITPDLSNKDDPEWVHKTNKFLEEVVTKDARNRAKMANFGFPGALGLETFYRNCRESGVVLTMDEAKEMRDAWIRTFYEMREHMKPERIPRNKEGERQFGFRDGDCNEEGEEESRDRYRCKVINGMVRNNCSFNAACNTQLNRG